MGHLGEAKNGKKVSGKKFLMAFRGRQTKKTD